MSNKRARLVLASSGPLENSKLPEINWSACCICQKTDSNLVCPRKNPILGKRHGDDAERNGDETERNGYVTLSTNLEKLKGLGHTLPSNRPVTSLDDGGGIFDTLKKNEAKWHKNCYTKYMPPKLDNLLKNLQHRGQKSEDGLNSNAPKSYSTRGSSKTIRMKDELCYFCLGVATWKEPLHHCRTDDIYDHVKVCASTIQDSRLLGMLETGGDLVAQEAKYHKTCLTRLYNAKRRLSCTNELESNVVFCEGMAFAELVSFIEVKLSSSPKIVFRMAELHKQYSQRVGQLLGEAEQHFDHTTRLRQKILAHFPQLSSMKSGREYILAVEGTDILTNCDSEDQDEDAVAFFRFITKLRKCLLNKKNEFNGSFSDTCQEDSIPGPLMASMSALCYGSSNLTSCGATAPLLSICQLLMANIRKGMPQGEVVRHSKDREPPLLLYTGLAAYGRHRDKSSLIEMHKRGLSVSADRVAAVTSQLCRLVVKRAIEENVVCPANLRRGLHTMGAIDNVDFKSKSNTSKGEFHGTGISIFQSRETGVDGEIRRFTTNFSDVADGGERSVPQLPDFYSVVPDIVLPREKPHSPGCGEELGSEMIAEGLAAHEWKLEADWLSQAHSLISDSDDSEQNISWAAFHASKECRRKPASLNAMLPLFYRKSTDPAMIKHAIDMVMAVTEHVNSDQPAVVGCDLPIFVLGKLIQWNWPEKYGAKNLLLMMGPLHIEMAFLKVIGSLLDGCGWLQIVASSGIVTSGSAEALLKVTHVKRSREAYQVTAAVLYSLMTDAYEEKHPGHEISFDEWSEIQSRESPTFFFWRLMLNLMVLYLTFVRSVRESKYDLYKDCIRGMLPWFFLLDHQLYARWLSVHLADLHLLPSTSPYLHRQFMLGKFTVNKSSDKPFSDIGLDHAHEQNNKVVKGSGGAVGLTHDPASLRRFTVGGPEVAQLLQEFNSIYDIEVDDQHEDLQIHHEQKKSYQTRFADFCAALKDSFLACENPFTVTGPSLMVVDESRVVMDDIAVKDLMQAGDRGRTMYKEFVQERLVTKSKSIYDPMKKCKFSIFRDPKKCATVSTVKQLKAEVQLFSRLFIVSTARALDLDEFFKYENQYAPPSLSLNGALRGGDKAKLVPILEAVVPPEERRQFSNNADGVVFDGPVLVHAIKPPKTMKYFHEYCNYLNYIIRQICERLNVERYDIVWDMYHALSLKGQTRDQRGVGPRRPGLPKKGILPTEWDTYLQNNENKEELFSYLATKLYESAGDTHFVTNNGTEILSTRETTLISLDFEGLEEADGRLILHAMDMVSAGMKKILIKSLDADVVVLAVSYFPTLRDRGLKELWVLCGKEKKRRYVAAHSIAQALGDQKAIALRAFHAITGCDTVSYFCGIGKRSFFSAWTTNEETDAMFYLSHPQENPLDPEILPVLEKFVSKAYGVKGEESSSLTSSRKYMFGTLGRLVNKIPPSIGCFEMHLLRSAYQSGQVWGRALDATKPECPSRWGRRLQDGQWQPIWSTQEAIWSKVQALYKCGCTTGCGTMRCNCRKNSLNCILACKMCKGNCDNKN